MNPMRRIILEKVTINMSAGESGPKLESYKKVLEKITGKKVMITKTRKRTTFGPGKKQIGVKTTFRGKEAADMLKRMLQAVENRLKPGQFDTSGNFSFGVKEYINIPGIEYDPDVGIIGMDVCVTLERPGFRVKKRSRKRSRVGKGHLITKEEAMEFARKEFGISITEGEE